MSGLQESIRRYYAEKSMSDARLEAILQGGERRGFWWSHARLLAAATVLIVLCLGVYQQVEQAQFKERVLAEIAMNHRKNLAIEVASTRFVEIEEKLDRLDFSIVPSPSSLVSELTGLALVGGRYCSIQGELAALLKMSDSATGKMLTLYVARLDEPLIELTPLEANSGEVYVRCWRDGERFFALAANAEVGRQ